MDPDRIERDARGLLVGAPPEIIAGYLYGSVARRECHVERNAGSPRNLSQRHAPRWFSGGGGQTLPRTGRDTRPPPPRRLSGGGRPSAPRRYRLLSARGTGPPPSPPCGDFFS